MKEEKTITFLNGFKKIKTYRDWENGIKYCVVAILNTLKKNYLEDLDWNSKKKFTKKEFEKNIEKIKEKSFQLIEMINNSNNHDFFGNRITLASALIYIASILVKFKITQSTIARATEGNEVSIRNNMKKILVFLKEKYPSMFELYNHNFKKLQHQIYLSF
jgi:hypothetical protein